jgi:hypothetical protein
VLWRENILKPLIIFRHKFLWSNDTRIGKIARTVPILVNRRMSSSMQ